MLKVPHHPVEPSQRHHELDVLRRFALFGILLANVLMLSGIFFRQMAGAIELSLADTWLLHALDVLVHGKFYSIFSLLFGLGFYIFLSRAEQRNAAVRALFCKRLLFLLLIGLVHAFFIWAGDILTLYALLGFLLLLFYRCHPNTLLFWILGLLGLRILVYGIMWWSGMGHPLAPPPAEPGSGSQGNDFDPITAMIAGFQGSYPEVLRANMMQLFGRWVSLMVSIRPPVVLAMFLIGLWIGRTGLLQDLSARNRLLRRWAVWGVALGLPMNGLWLFLMGDTYPNLPGSAKGMLEVIVTTIGVPLLAVGYAAAIALLMNSPRARHWMMWLAPVGRMALTNYLMQSVLSIFIFYGFGLGLYGKVSVSTALVMMIPVFLIQVLYSTWWLRRFRFGPAEWLWRRWTYGGHPNRDTHNS